MRRRGVPQWLASIIGILVVLIVWWLASAAFFQDFHGKEKPIPSPWTVFHVIGQDGIRFYWNNFEPTLKAALLGFVWGDLLALVLASTVLLWPRIEWFVMQIAVVTYCMPIVAIGGIAVVTLGGAQAPGDPSKTSILLAAEVVFFTTVSGALLGFKSATKASLDVVRVYGGSRLTQLRKVRLIAALPAILNALQIAVPTSILGAVLGEYLGKTDRSVGSILIRFQSTGDSVRMWAFFVVCSVVAMIGYLIVGLISRFVTSWSAGKAGVM